MTRQPKAARQDRWSEEFGDEKAHCKHHRFGALGRALFCLIGAICAVEVCFTYWNRAPEHNRMWLVEGDGGVGTTSLAVAPTGSLIATTNTAGGLSLLDEELGWRKNNITDFPGQSASVAFTPDGHFLAVGGIGILISLGERERDRNERFAFLPFRSAGENLKAMAFSPDGRCLATASDASSQVVVWDRADRQEKLILSAHAPILTLAFSPDSRYLAAGQMGDRAAIDVWKLENGCKCLVLDGSRGHVAAIAFSPDGSILATTAMFERGIRLWDMHSGRLQRVITGHPYGTNSVAFAPDGDTLASVGNDGMARLWMVSTGDQRAVFDGRAHRLNHVAFAPNGQILIATSSGDDDVRLWELPSFLVRSSLF